MNRSAAGGLPDECWGTPPLRLVILSRSLDYGGAERQIVALARGLHERGHRVVVAVLYSGGPLEHDLQAAGVPVQSFAKRGRWDVIGFLLRLIRFLRRERPQIVHGYLEFQNVLATLTQPIHRGRVVWGVRASDRPMARYDWLVQVVNRFERVASRFPDLIISNSHAGRAHVLSLGFPANRVIVIPNGIDTDRFRPDPVAGRRLRDELGISHSDAVVGLVGRFDPMKDHPSFLTAAAQLAAQRAEVRFLSVGAGPAETAAALAARAERLGVASRVIWAGPRGDMPAVFNALDVAVSASSSGEGFPNVVGEAMACGVPCVVTDVGDSARVVGDRGEVVPPRDPIALAAGIDRLLTRAQQNDLDPVAIRMRIVEEFSVRSLVEQTEAVLTSVIEGGIR